MPRVKNNKLKTDKKPIYSPHAIEGHSAGFHCSWPTFWMVIFGVAAFLAALYPICNSFLNAKIKPAYREIELCKEQVRDTKTLISVNEQKRDEKVSLQIQIIEQKIEFIKNNGNK